MHEFSVAKSIINIIIKESEKAGFSKIKKVRLKVGILSGVDICLLNKALELIKKENLLTSGTVFLIEEEGIKIYCLTCNRQTRITKVEFRCSFCGSEEIEIKEGSSLHVMSIVGE